MPGEAESYNVIDAHEVVLRARCVDQVADRGPHQSVGGVVGAARFAADAQHAAHCVANWCAVAAEQDHRWCAVAGDVGAGRVDDVREVDLREELLYDLLAELALHERVGSDHPDIAGRRL